MKVIDLLNKKANGEEIPEKIKLLDSIYIYKHERYQLEGEYDEDEDYKLFDRYNYSVLNEEVEILDKEGNSNE